MAVTVVIARPVPVVRVELARVRQPQEDSVMQPGSCAAVSDLQLLGPTIVPGNCAVVERCLPTTRCCDRTRCRTKMCINYDAWVPPRRLLTNDVDHRQLGYDQGWRLGCWAKLATQRTDQEGLR